MGNPSPRGVSHSQGPTSLLQASPSHMTRPPHRLLLPGGDPSPSRSNPVDEEEDPKKTHLKTK